MSRAMRINFRRVVLLFVLQLWLLPIAHAQAPATSNSWATAPATLPYTIYKESQPASGHWEAASPRAPRQKNGNDYVDRRRVRPSTGWFEIAQLSCGGESK